MGQLIINEKPNPKRIALCEMDRLDWYLCDYRKGTPGAGKAMVQRIYPDIFFCIFPDGSSGSFESYMLDLEVIRKIEVNQIIFKEKENR